MEVWHPALRYGLVQKLDASGEQHEIAADPSVLFVGQSAQWQTDVAALVERACTGVTADARARTQLPVAHPSRRGGAFLPGPQRAAV